MNGRDPSKIRTYSHKDRPSKVRFEELASAHRKGGSLGDFLSSLPDILAARHLRDVAAAIVQARKDERPVMLGMGAHPIKVGLAPVIIDLLERGINSHSPRFPRRSRSSSGWRSRPRQPTITPISPSVTGK